jgi:hypothetical protein
MAINMKNEYRLLVTTDIIVGSQNLGETITVVFNTLDKAQAYARDLFEGVKPLYFNDLACYSSSNKTITLSATFDGKYIDIKNFLEE